MAEQLQHGSVQVKAAFLDRVRQMEAIAAQCSLGKLATLEGHGEKMFLLADAMQQLRELITVDMMKSVMALQGSPLGFRTDKDKEEKPGYPVEVVKEVFVEAMIRGAHMIGNETNIIGARWYGTKEYFDRKVREFPGLTNFRPVLSPPTITSSGLGAVVKASATWKRDGRNEEYKEAEIPIRINQGQIVDAIMGKAERKLLARVYKQLTGNDQPEGDAGDALDNAVNVTTAAKDEKPETKADAAPPAPAADAARGDSPAAAAGAEGLRQTLAGKGAAKEGQLPLGGGKKATADDDIP